MKIHRLVSCLAVALFLVLVAITPTHGQGTITFDAHPYFSSTNYNELGLNFHVVIPTARTIDDMGIAPAIFGASNIPYNNTPYMGFAALSNSKNYVFFNLSNGYSFGLTSVQLADPNSPSASQIPILFVGFLGNGSSVTNIFTTPGGGATTFQNYLFSSAFASGLTSVDILAPRWAMDNLVFGNVAPVPEPGTVGLIAAGLLALAARKFRRR